MKISLPVSKLSLLAPALIAPSVLINKPVLAATAQTASANAPRPTPSLSGWTYGNKSDELESAWTWTARLDSSGPFETRVGFHLDAKGNGLMLRVEGTPRAMTLSFWRVVGGKIEKLGAPATTIELPEGAKGQLALQRSPWRARALWNGRVVLTAWSDLSGGTLGTVSRGGVKLQTGATPIQETEPVVARDDFMRAQGPDDPEKPGEWHRAAGIWKTSGLLGPRDHASVNPNPFVFRAEAPAFAISTVSSQGVSQPAIATIGHWFWSDYTVAASVRPTFANAKGPLVALLSAYRAPDEGKTNLSGVAGGVDFRAGTAFLRSNGRVVATSRPFAVSSDQWHRVLLDPGPGTLRLLVDGVERVRWDADAISNAQGEPAQGVAALEATLGSSNFVDFDDVRIGPSQAVSDEFRQSAVGRWNDALGEWQTRAANNNGMRLKLTNGPALTLTGGSERDEGRVEASFAQLGAGKSAYGVAFGARDAKNYFAARVRALGAGRVLEIVQYEKGIGRILSNRALSGAMAPIAAEWREGVITARSGSVETTATVSDVPAGRVGAWADGAAKSVGLRAFRALGATPQWGETALPGMIAKDYLMDNWASNAKAWKAMQGKSDKTRWHTGDFFRDAALTLPLPDLNSASNAKANLTLLLRADPAVPDSGARLNVERTGDVVSLKLSEGGHAVGTTTLKASEAKGSLRFVRQPVGNGRVALRVALEGRALLSGSAKVEHEGTRAGLKVQGTHVSLLDSDGHKIESDLNWEDARATTSAVLDYTFTSAPVDWETSRGQWDVAERWTCTPFWGFFSGGGDPAPTLWSRFGTKGDFTLEAYLATPMDQTRGERSPIDLNVSVGGNGRDLSSAYSFMFGAKERTVNRIMRGDQVVWEKPFELPQVKDSTHRDWFYVRLERRTTPAGLRFRYSVNDRVVAEYTDAQPMNASSAGRVAFWSYNGSISVARARLWHSGVEAGNDAPNLMPIPLAPRPAESGLKNALGEWGTRVEGPLAVAARYDVVSDGGKRALKIVNPRSGGDWTLYVARKAFDAARQPTLKWDYRVPANVRVNLYVKVENKWREILFTGNASRVPQKPERIRRGRRGEPFAQRPPIVPFMVNADKADIDRSFSIGTVEGTIPDDKWHSASFNLLKALRDAGLPTKVEAIAFAAPDVDYLRAGLGGNHLGATYFLSGLEAPAAPATTTVAALP